MERLTQPHRTRPAFTLLELIMVIAIISIIAVLVIPAMKGYLSASRLGTTSSVIAAELGEARQLAQTLNRVVELRFYRYADPEIPGAMDAYCSRQLFVREPSGYLLPRGPAVPFETGVIVMNDPERTTVLKNGELIPTDQDLRLARVGSKYHYFEVVFQPGGGIRLGKGAKDRWCLTLVLEKDCRAPNVLPPNFVTIQLDPHNGSVRTLQP